MEVCTKYLRFRPLLKKLYLLNSNYGKLIYNNDALIFCVITSKQCHKVTLVSYQLYNDFCACTYYSMRSWHNNYDLVHADNHMVP